MEHRDLLRRASDLRELLEHPGWAFLQELVGVHADMVRKAVDRDPDVLARLIAKDPVDAARMLGRAGGELRGLKQALGIPADVVAVADEVERIIDEGEQQ